MAWRFIPAWRRSIPKSQEMILLDDTHVALLLHLIALRFGLPGHTPEDKRKVILSPLLAGHKDGDQRTSFDL